MKEWLTAHEIAAEALPSMPSTKRGVQDYAEREAWTSYATCYRQRSGRGGGLEYSYRLLPTEAQVEYERRHRPAIGHAADNDDSRVANAVSLSGRAALERDARLAVLRAYERFAKGKTLRQAAAMELFASKYNARALTIEDWILDVIPKLSRRSLQRWRASKGTGSTLGTDRSIARKGKGVLDLAEDGGVRTFVLGLVAFQPHLSADAIRDQIRSEFGDTLTVPSKGVRKSVSVPPVRTIQHWLGNLKKTHADVLMKMTSPDEYRSKRRMRGTGTLRHVIEPNQLWQIDASPVDAQCTDGRHQVYACIDIATRRAIFHVSKTPRASAVGLLLRKAILAWGVPHEIKTDNGSDFVAAETQRLMASLDIEWTVSPPFTPEDKAHVERVIGTMQRAAVALLPGFVGHNVSDRKKIEARKAFATRLGEDDADTFAVQYSADKVQAFIDEWATLKYQHRRHSALKGRTPYEVAALAGDTIRTVDERALDLLLAPAASAKGYRVVGPQGIRVDGYHYLSPEIPVGTHVFVRHDPSDIGRIMAFDAESETFLDEALCAELAGIPPEAFVRATKERHAEIRREAEKAIEAERRKLRKGPDLAERARRTWLNDQPNVTALPKKQEEHTTPAIAAALDAADGPKAPKAKGLSGAAAERHAALQAQHAGAHSPGGPEQTSPTPKPSNVTKLDTPQTRFRRARAIEAAMERGEEIPAEDALWLGGYREGPEYRAMAAMAKNYAAQT